MYVWVQTYLLYIATNNIHFKHSHTDQIETDINANLCWNVLYNKFTYI